MIFTSGREIVSCPGNAVVSGGADSGLANSPGTGAVSGAWTAAGKVVGFVDTACGRAGVRVTLNEDVMSDPELFAPLKLGLRRPSRLLNNANIVAGSEQELFQGCEMRLDETLLSPKRYL